MTFEWPILLLAVALVPLGILAARAIDGRRRRRLAGLGGLGRLASGPGSAPGGSGRPGGRSGAAGGPRR